MLYAVIEWDKGSSDDWCRVIAKNKTKEIADLLMKITPPHLEREVITMREYQKRFRPFNKI